jgi:glutaconyl-CoA decarboxylase
MKPYFEKMNDLGKALTEQQIKNAEGNVKQIREVEKTVSEAVEKVKKAGLAAEEINKRGEMTVYQRLEYLLDPGTWCPLHTLFDPMGEESGTTGVVDGLGRISGKWAVIIGFDNKVMAGAWIAGQSENILRVTDMAKRLHLPLVWLVNCSGVKLTEQEKVYANRRGSGTTFFRHAELEKLGLPVLAGISVEYIRWTANHLNSPIVRFLIKPNLALQALTTREPDAAMLEVAIQSFKTMRQAEQELVV